MGNMRILKVLVIGMGVLIVVGTTVLIVLIAHRLGGVAAPSPAAPSSVLLAEPAGTRIAGVAGAGNRLAVWLQGGGADRVVLVDPQTSTVTGRIGLRGQ